MPPERPLRRLAHGFLSALPFLAVALAAPRPLRAPGLHAAIGSVVFAATLLAAWSASAASLRSNSQRRVQLALGGLLLLAPFALISLLWVGLGTPWDATPSENQMRYLVLLAMAVCVTLGLVMLRVALVEAGERVHSTLALGAIALAGPVYVAWNACMFGMHVQLERIGAVPATFTALDEALDLMLFAAGTLTYVATAALARAFANVQWLGRRCALVFVLLNLVAVGLLLARGVHFLSPSELSTPWYATPGFVAGIPAVPYVMPALLGALSLRRASTASD